MKASLKMKGKNILTTVVEDVKDFKTKRASFSISQEELKKLDKNVFFAEATKEGFSKEIIRKIYEPALDYIIEKLDLKKISKSLTMTYIKLRYRKINLKTINGSSLFDLLDSNGLLDYACSPEYKKEIICRNAYKLVVNEGDISFNTALKRSMTYIDSQEFICSEIKLKKQELLDLVNIINPLINFYFENEKDFIALFLKK